MFNSVMHNVVCVSSLTYGAAKKRYINQPKNHPYKLRGCTNSDSYISLLTPLRETVVWSYRSVHKIITEEYPNWIVWNKWSQKYQFHPFITLCSTIEKNRCSSTMDLHSYGHLVLPLGALREKIIQILLQNKEYEAPLEFTYCWIVLILSEMLTIRRFRRTFLMQGFFLSTDE